MVIRRRIPPAPLLLTVLLVIAAPARAGAEAAIRVVVSTDGVVDAESLASELAVRLPDARVRVSRAGDDAAAAGYSVSVTTAQRSPRLRLRVRDPDGMTIVSHRARAAAPTQTARELAVLIEGAIRLQRREIDELLRRLASDIPRLALALHLGGRWLPDVPRLTPFAAVALRLRLWRSLVTSLVLEAALPWNDTRAEVDQRVWLFALRGELAYGLPFSQLIAFVGAGLDLSLMLGRFDLPRGGTTNANELSLSPLIVGQLEWPRDARLRLVAAGSLGYALTHPEFQWAGQRVVALGPWSVRMSLGGRWVF